MNRKASRKPADSRKRSAVVRRRAPTGPLVLGSECLIESADALKKDLLLRLDAASPLSIDARRVDRIDAASLQVLAAFARDCRAAGRDLEWVGASAVLTGSARLLDLSSTLGL